MNGVQGWINVCVLNLLEFCAWLQKVILYASWSGWWEEAEATDQNSECKIVFLLWVQQGFTKDLWKPGSHGEYLDSSVVVWWLEKGEVIWGKKRGIEISNPEVAFQQRQGSSLDHVTRHFKILSGQMCKLTVLPLERWSHTGTVKKGMMNRTKSLMSM